MDHNYTVVVVISDLIASIFITKIRKIYTATGRLIIPFLAKAMSRDSVAVPVKTRGAIR
ncbi:MAG: hypothetical protein IME93_00075 [Proteobacteria bacterium]|nr:hypothetical protein [Pseudomonadota bacterium]